MASFRRVEGGAYAYLPNCRAPVKPQPGAPDPETTPHHTGHPVKVTGLWGGSAAAAIYVVSGERSHPLAAEFRSSVSAALMGLPKAAGRMRTRIDGLTKGGRLPLDRSRPLRFRSGSAHRPPERKGERNVSGRVSGRERTGRRSTVPKTRIRAHPWTLRPNRSNSLYTPLT